LSLRRWVDFFIYGLLYNALRISDDSVIVVTQKNMVMGPTGPRTKNDYADGAQKQFTQTEAISISENIAQIGRMIGE
jgi:hypothetical protein